MVSLVLNLQLTVTEPPCSQAFLNSSIGSLVPRPRPRGWLLTVSDEVWEVVGMRLRS